MTEEKRELHWLIKESLEDKVHEIFFEMQKRLGIESGDISPLMSFYLSTEEHKFAVLIQRVLDEQMGEREEEESKETADLIRRYPDGREEVVRSNVSKDEEILFGSDYVARKLWDREDIAGYLREEGYEGTDEEVDAVLKEGVSFLNRPTEQDEETIIDAIRHAKHSGHLKSADDDLEKFGLDTVKCQHCIHCNSAEHYCSVYDEHHLKLEDDPCSHYNSAEPNVKLYYGAIWIEFAITDPDAYKNNSDPAGIANAAAKKDRMIADIMSLSDYDPSKWTLGDITTPDQT